MKKTVLQYSLRILLSPFIFLYGIFLLAAGTLFPLPLMVGFSFFGLLYEPLVWLLRKSGSNITGIEPYMDITCNNALNHFIGITIYIWGAPAVMIDYVLTGKIWNGE